MANVLMIAQDDPQTQTQHAAADMPGKRRIVSKSPLDGSTLGEVYAADPNDAPHYLARARQAQPAWDALGVRERAKVMRRLKSLLRRDMDRIVALMAAEVGRPKMEALVEFWPTIEQVAFDARHAASVLRPRREAVPLLPYRVHWVERRPYGVALIISPWNFPLLLTLAPVVEALITGNAVVLKPSELATQLNNHIAELIWEAGVPKDVFQIVHGLGDVGAALINAGPDKVVFTGSPNTARKIASAAGQQLIPLTLELGGKDAAIVLEDADLDRTALALVWGGLLNTGQACLSVERVYVRREVAEALVDKMQRAVDRYVTVGERPGEGTLGPINNPAQYSIVEAQVAEALANGAATSRKLDGLDGLNGSGGEGSGSRPGPLYYPPTILLNTTPQMRVVREETFGPVIVVTAVESDAEAVRLANAAPFGLTGSVWTRSRARGMVLLRQMRVGHASLNDHIVSASAPNLPWGGFGHSGYGRTRGKEGLLAMTEPRVISAERFAPLPREIFWYPYTAAKYALLRRVIYALYAPTLREKLRALFAPLPR
jgi:acyl-CoA reductase-like NAD-dependent aldehyde dehydrogenase